MLGIRTILHPTDFSKNSEYARHLAAALARDYNAHLVVLHVQPIPVAVYGYGEGILPPTVEARDELLRKLEGLDIPGVWTTHRLEEGDAVTEILNVAKDMNADLIVMGTHGGRGLTRLLMGSVAELVVRRANCPVLTIRHPFHEQIPMGETEAAEERQYAI